MPKLLMLCVCEKTIIDQGQLPSLISIFQRVNVEIASDTPMPPNALAPGRWNVFCLWQHSPSEKDQEFVQVMEVRTPDDSVFVTNKLGFKVVEENDLHSKNNIELFGIPINVPGTIKVRVWLESSPDDVAGEYLFHINHIVKTPASAQSDPVN